MAKTYIQAILACVIWGFSYVWTEIGLRSFYPVTLVLLRLLIGSILMFIVIRSTKKLQRIKYGDAKLFLLLAAMEPFVYFMGETYAQTMVSATLTSVVISTIPVFAPLSAYIFLKEKISIPNMVGVVISLGGVLCIVLTDRGGLSGNLFGIGLLALAVLSAIVYAVVLRKLAYRYNSASIVFYQNLIGLFYFLPVFFITDFSRLGDLPFRWDAFISIVFLAIFASVLAFVMFSNAVRVLGVARSNVFCNLMPVFTALFAWVALGDVVTAYKITGICVVIVGLFVSQLQSFKLKNSNE